MKFKKHIDTSILCIQIKICQEKIAVVLWKMESRFGEMFYIFCPPRGGLKSKVSGKRLLGLGLMIA